MEKTLKSLLVKSIFSCGIIITLSSCGTTRNSSSSTDSKSIPSVTTEKKIEFERWQQRVEYTMDVDFDHIKHQYKGQQRIVYYNNSPDALKKVFFHLYMNAFQPNSIMDIRSRTITDPDGRVADRISKLKPDEIGYLNIKTLTINGKPCTFHTEGTILEVTLPEAIAPLSKVTFDMTYDGQVPLQIRRNGRMSREGVDYSMAQWYPKLCEYDYQGWHANPYVGREFYGVWGDFDVKIAIDQKYTIGGTGILQNAEVIGKGYAPEPKSPFRRDDGKIVWHFVAKNVHDFMWGADPNYKHITKVADDGTKMHFFYIPSEKTNDAWERAPAIMAKAFAFIRDNYGQYPYSDFSFVQGGDGGMEYPMSTLITGERNLISLIGVSVHELMHSWYQGVLGSNESLYAWMDEGFTSFSSNYVMNDLKAKGLLPGFKPEADPMKGDIAGYVRFAMSGNEEPLSVHADHFTTNTAYGIGSYVKGATFLQQLKYIVGEDNFKKGMLTYFDAWKFKHPNVNDFIRVHEKTADLELDWFKEYFVNTTHRIDFAVDKVASSENGTRITIKKVEKMPMPLDIEVTYTDGKKEMFYIPLDLMRGEKPQETPSVKRTILPDWTWAFPTYNLDIKVSPDKIAKIEIDPSGRMADVNTSNNIWGKPKP